MQWIFSNYRHLCFTAFGNRSVGGQVGGSIPLSPFSPDRTLFMRPLCLVTMVREKERAWSSCEKQTIACGKLEKDEVVSYLTLKFVSGCFMCESFQVVDKIICGVEAQVLTLQTLCLSVSSSHPQFWRVCLISGYFSNVWAERVSGSSKRRCHENNEDHHQKWWTWAVSYLQNPLIRCTERS